MKIIIVDDETKIRNGLLKLLSSHKQWEVPGAFADAESAFDFLRTNQADVIITDIKMPEVSGLELIKRIREVNKKVQIVILSGYSNFSYAQRAIEMGVRRYLTKPTNPREVISILTEIEEETKTEKVIEPQPETITSEAENTGVNNLVVEKTLKYIEENFEKKITLKEISEKLYLSPNYLCKLFKKYSGKNLSEYITEYRIKKAKEYLKDVKYKVSDVADMVGFGDTQYFSSTFKKVCGLTPLEYRNKRKTDSE